MINWNNPITRGLAFATPLSERGGTTVQDIAKRRNGALTNTPTWITGRVGTGIKFLSASSQYISINSNPDPNNVGQACAIEVLIKPTTLPQGPSFFFHVGESDNFGFGIGIGDGAGNSGSKLQGLNDNIAWIGGGPTLTNNTLYHVVFSKASSSANWLYYLNGALSDSGSSTSNGGMSPFATIGAEVSSTSSASRFFDGEIYYVRFWTRGLSSWEVGSLYANPWQIYVKPGMLQSLNSIAAAVAKNSTFKTLTGAGNI